MKQAIVLQHVRSEGPVRIELAFREAGIGCEVRRLDLGARVPETLARDELLVIMGGPMGVADLGSPEYPFLTHEVALIQQCLAERKPLLGVCLGAQLVAHAAGARVYPATRSAAAIGAEPERAYEVGFAEVTFHGTNQRPVLAGIATREVMLHWHGDTFDLPNGAELLASTDTCPNQAFQIGARAFGFQFHCEVEAETVRDWLETDRGFVERALGPNGARQIREDAERWLPQVRAAGDRLLKNVVRSLCE